MSHPPFPAADADLCVKCGLCLPHCPSYARTGQEGDSPRGRIALMQALDSGQLPPGERLQAHLDGCLGCRACEPVCPARVPYTRILDAGRAQLLARRPSAKLRLSLRLLSHPVGQGLLQLTRRLWQALRPSAWAHGIYRQGRLGRLLSLLPPRRLAPSTIPPAAVTRGAVTLWSGCTGHSLEPEVLHAAQQLLSALGFEVQAISGCCGAMAAHGGLADTGAAQAATLAKRLGGTQPVLGLASGCLAQLRGGDPALALRAEEVLGFLRRHWPAGLRLKPLPARVAIHRACTQRNLLRSDGDLDWLLRQLPEVQVEEIDAQAACCGAAGHHLLLQAEIADAHLAPKLARLATLQADWVLSANVGCSLHFAGGLRRAGLKAPQVVHPLVLLARQWPAPG
jgi:glycolate oxidase iron-sulfur subunit